MGITLKRRRGEDGSENEQCEEAKWTKSEGVKMAQKMDGGKNGTVKGKFTNDGQKVLRWKRRSEHSW